MKDAEEVIVVSGEDNNLAVRERRFREPHEDTVLCDPRRSDVAVEAAERQASQDASQRGNDHFFVGLLNEYRASAALIRQWTGHDPAIAQREARIEMLERLVWDAIYALQKAGLDSEAHRLRRAIEKT